MRLKHPKTPHLPDSLTISRDDKVLDSIEHLQKLERVIVSVKLDGEAFTGYYNGVSHARSVDSNFHPSRSWAKRHWANVFNLLPAGWRIQCESLYAKHSIAYDDLESFLYGIVIWDEKNMSLPWDQSLEWFEKLQIPPVPVFFEDKLKYPEILNRFKELNEKKEMEGFVVRNYDSFHYDNFEENTAKWVRKNHVQTDEHWMHQKIIPNKLKPK